MNDSVKRGIAALLVAALVAVSIPTFLAGAGIVAAVGLVLVVYGLLFSRSDSSDQED